VDLYASVLDNGNELTLDGITNRRVFVQVVSGELAVNSQPLRAGDGAQIRDADSIHAVAKSESELLLFNMS